MDYIFSWELINHTVRLLPIMSTLSTYFISHLGKENADRSSGSCFFLVIKLAFLKLAFFRMVKTLVTLLTVGRQKKIENVFEPGLDWF